jgi:hypothetical protein
VWELEHHFDISLRAEHTREPFHTMSLSNFSTPI